MRIFLPLFMNLDNETRVQILCLTVQAIFFINKFLKIFLYMHSNNVYVPLTCLVTANLF